MVCRLLDYLSVSEKTEWRRGNGGGGRGGRGRGVEVVSKGKGERVEGGEESEMPKG